MATYMFFNERDAVPTSREPEVALTKWRLLRAENGDRHLTAELPNGSLRITSPIEAADLAGRCLTTRSGRRYLLQEAPTADDVLLGKLAANAIRSGLGDAIDISDQLWADCMAASS